MKTLIVAGGRMDRDFSLSFFCRHTGYDKVIAVDGGLEALHGLGIVPTDIVGDFDTVQEELLKSYEAMEGITIRHFRPQKDNTDSEIAVELALKAGSDEIDLLGVSGTRLDHTLGNIRLLGIIKRAGRQGFFYDRHNRMRLVDGTCVIKREEQYGKYVSLLPFTQTVSGITLKGFKYPLKDYRMELFEMPTLGISNEIVETEGKIICTEGILLVIEAED